MNVEITPAMLATLEKLVQQHRDDTPADQEALCVKVGQDEPEIGVKLREMFKAAKLTDLSAVKPALPATEPEVVKAVPVASWRRHQKPKPEALFISPALQPSIELAPTTPNPEPSPKPIPEVAPATNVEEPAKPQPKDAVSLSKLLTSLGAQKREELFKTLIADKALTTTQPLAFQHSKSPTGIPASLENAATAINKLDIDCRYDVFHDRIIVKGHECGINGDALENLENVTLKVRQAVLTRFGFDPSATFTFDALKLRCLDRVFDPVRDYLDTLKWDGKARLDDWLIDYCGAKDTELNKAIGRKMLVAGVRRVRNPGCKFDYIVVLESRDQGIGKSTVLKILAGEENFSDAEIIGLDKREQQEAIQGVWIYEVAELDGLHKSDITKVKLFASKTVDSARPAYARSRVDRPRRGIFVATTNEDTYLRDTTGNRRFWPVRLHGIIASLDGKMMIDLAGVERDRDQLWAEASIVEATGEPLVIPEALWLEVAQQQQVRMELDPWMDVLACRLMMLKGKVDGSYCQAADNDGNPEWRVATDWLLTVVLGLPKERQYHNHTKRLASIMRQLGWEKPETVIRIGKEVKRGFTKPIEAS